jgi:hypothetical protein
MYGYQDYQDPQYAGNTVWGTPQGAGIQGGAFGGGKNVLETPDAVKPEKGILAKLTDAVVDKAISTAADSIVPGSGQFVSAAMKPGDGIAPQTPGFKGQQDQTVEEDMASTPVPKAPLQQAQSINKGPLADLDEENKKRMAQMMQGVLV